MTAPSAEEMAGAVPMSEKREAQIREQAPYGCGPSMCRDMLAEIDRLRAAAARLREPVVVVPVPRSVYLSEKPSGDYEVVMNYSQDRKTAYAARDAIKRAALPTPPKEPQP